MTSRLRRVHTAHQYIQTPVGAIEVDAAEPITITDRREVTITGGNVRLVDSDATVTGRAVVHAEGDCRITIPRRNPRVIVYAADHVEVDAQSGYVYGDDYSRLFLSGDAACEVTDRALARALGRRVIVNVVGGAPTVRADGGARVFVAKGLEYTA